MRQTEEELQIAREGLAGLIGLPLADMWRYMGFQKFDFGEERKVLNRKGGESLRYDYGLVVGSDWKIEGPDGFMVGSEHFDPVRRDEHANEFYRSLAARPIIVEQVDVRDDGGLRLALTDGFRLSIDIGEPMPDEVWRLLPASDDPLGQLVLDVDGLGWSRQ